MKNELKPMKMNWFGPMKNNLISLNTEFDALKSIIIKKDLKAQND